MKPKPTVNDPQDDLFKTRLSDLINPNHALCRLAHQIDWAQLEKHIAPHFRDLGAAAIPVRLVAGQLYLEHAFKVSDERVDRGYRDSGYEGDATIIIAGQKRGVSQLQQRRLNRRNSIEPIIGHMKQDGKLVRCYLKGQTGDAINVILCGAGQNIRKLLRWLCFAWYLLNSRKLHWLFLAQVKPQSVVDDSHSASLAA